MNSGRAVPYWRLVSGRTLTILEEASGGAVRSATLADEWHCSEAKARAAIKGAIASGLLAGTPDRATLTPYGRDSMNATHRRNQRRGFDV